MQARRILVLCGATVALALILAATSLAAGTTVSVRVEGKARTLLQRTVVHTYSGSITKGAAPKGSCPATSAAGALDQATHGDWGGKTFAGTPGILITSILGERDLFSRGFYWSVWIDNRVAPAGICALELHRGDQLLFAPNPAKGSTHPIAIEAPKRASTNHPFALKVVYYTNGGQARPLAGATISTRGFTARTDRHGVAQVGVTSAGRFSFTAAEKGYIRAAPVTVRVG